MDTKLNWGIIGTGKIAKRFAIGLAHSKTGRLIAVGSRSEESACKFGDEFKISKCYGSYESLLADKDVKAVYISTPHSLHAKWAIRSAEAGKHVLCEKPVSINSAESAKIIEAARKNKVFFMEAFMYRCHPQTAKLIEILKQKVIGDIKVIKAVFSYGAMYNPKSIVFDHILGGGGILDVGCYPVSISRLIAGIAVGKDFEDPIEVKGSGYIGKGNIDEYASAVLKFPGEIIAEVTAGITVARENTVQIFGTGGSISILTPWVPAREGGSTKIIVNKNGEPSKEVMVECSEYLYGIEADTVAGSINNGQLSNSAMSWNDTLGNMKVLDEWRASIGFSYDFEK
ncbi:MAG: hypothetical protein A2452_10455 [Candidatus Firestonebacteria bacterium RIFOXYC2_FULL_39_67]|nr:MAG: hypothetical protein A2536_06825 [Candidatus Firestonebacteria bacterium RIFOXYD2_FULL_39_29]OGF54322.1 MAG: hypothetical protein A2452_10455 [Candidatus Firestonebacteria bacterium RIFOXYC2_FULL_39_67]OGF58038.1 MAG: hypothetical protein A2497_06830 [Candidatus Firestonebacteria bacterium RifOxyC12_full_39_7]